MEEKKERILRERASALARRKDVGNGGESLDCVSFRLGGEDYALDSRLVAEVFRMGELTSLPGVPPFIAGIVNMRGQILSILDLRVVLDLPESESAGLERFVVVIRSDVMETGLLVDPPVEVCSIPVDSIGQPLPSPCVSRGNYIYGLADGGRIVLDGNGILGDPGLVVNSDPSRGGN